MITCACGEALFDEIDAETLTVDGKTFTFRRNTDYVACRRCGELRSVRSIRAEAVARGILDPPLPEDEDPTDAALSAIHDLLDEDSVEPDLSTVAVEGPPDEDA